MKWVKFKKIELMNYRQFKDVKITFPDHNTKKPFNIILGRNGFGKSNIFNAITWCFYGVEKHLKKGEEEEMLPLINESVAKHLKKGEVGEVKVTILLESDEGAYKLERVQNFRGTGEGLPYMEEGTRFNIMIEGEGNWYESMSPKTVVNRILPDVVTDFFFLDGEKLRQQFENIDEEEVKKTILDVSQINLLNKAIQHLGSIISEARRETRSETPEIEKIKEDLKHYEEKLKTIPKEIKEKTEQKKDAEKNKKELMGELRGCSVDHIKDLQKERDEIDKRLDENEGELEEVKQEYNDYLIEAAHTIYIADAIKETLEVINKEVKEGRLPPKIEKPFLEERLNKIKKCICEEDISGKDTASTRRRKVLLKLLEEKDLSEVTDDAKNLKYLLKSLVNSLKDFEAETDSYVKKIENFETKNKRDKGRREDIRIELEKFKGTSENIAEKEKEIKSYEQAIEDLISDIASLKKDEENFLEKQKERNKDFESALSKIGKQKEAIKKFEFLNNSYDVLTKIKDKLLNEIRKEIELNVQKNFFDYLITEKELEEIKIDENYKIFVMTKEGYNTLKSLSAGETLCLALSFMAALRNVSGFVAPIIIDTPLAKIDEEYRDNLLKFLVSSLKNTQITLLVMSSEYTEKVKSMIKPYRNSEWIIDFDKKSGVSEVTEND